jgi:hypothetical protein
MASGIMMLRLLEARLLAAPIRAVFSVYILVFVALMVSSCGAPIATVMDDSIHRYDDGKRLREVRVSLDRLYIERGSPQGEVTGREVYLLRIPVVSVAALEDVARQLRLAQSNIRDVSVFICDVHSAEKKLERLTRQVVVRGAEGVDLSALLARYDARLVELVDFSPNTGIAVTNKATVLAGLTLAQQLHALKDVMVAFPLTE